MKTAELHPAYLWRCDDCGRDNYVRAIVLSPEQIDDDDLPSYEAIEMVRGMAGEGIGGELSMIPDMVSCDHCGTQFQSVDRE